MGCNIGSVRKNEEKTMKFKWKPERTSKTASENLTDDTTEKTHCPLSKRQRFQIVKSWKAIARNIKDTGVNMFVRMGCSIGTVQNSDEKTLTKNWKPEKSCQTRSESHTDDIVDRTNCPLSKRQRFQIVKSWKAISRNIKDTGVNMFVRMFETNADIAALFIGFGNLADISSLRQSKRLENHATMVMHVLDEAISSMDDAEYVIEMLQGIGKSHRKIAGFDPNFFLKIEEPFLLAVQETLQDRYSANISHVYKITIRFILTELADGYRNAPDDDRYSEVG